MKKRFLFALLSLFPLVASADAWIDDWLQQKTVTSPGYFEGQRRGYLSGGSFQARWRMTNDAPFTIQLPKIKSGCGGIDIFAGGLSFLDPDLLVDKLQGILQAAPAVAFDMALKTMCKECSETMKAMERAAAWLNGMQLNDCAMTKRLVTSVASDDKDIAGDMWSEITQGVSLDQALNRNAAEVKSDAKANGGTPQVGLDQAVRDCPAEFKDIFSNGATNSVLTNISTKIGLERFAGIMRGYIGDVLVTYEDAANSFKIEPIQPCPGNDSASINDFLDGKALERDAVANGPCVNNTAIALNTWVNDTLESIATKKRANTALSPEEEAFIDSAPLPVDRYLSDAIATQGVNYQATISNLRQPVAYAYAYRAFDDLYKAVDRVVSKAVEAADIPGTRPGGDIDFCKPKVLEGAVAIVRKWRGELATYRRDAKNAYDSEIGTFAQHLQVISAARENMNANRKAEAANITGK